MTPQPPGGETGCARCTPLYSHAPPSNAAAVRPEAEILVYLQRERAQGMDEL